VKIGAIVQARMSSSRLPGKVMMPLPRSGETSVLEHVIVRLSASKLIDTVIVATTSDPSDDIIVDTAVSNSVPYFRGSMEDVLSRYYLAAKEHGLDIIVRITSDCPCISSSIVDEVIRRHCSSSVDYTSNTIVRTYPHGFDVEVFSFATLERAYNEATSSYDREHVTPYIYDTGAKAFVLQNVEAPESLCAPEIRITLDTADDYTVLCEVYASLYKEGRHFTGEDVVELFQHSEVLL
jgi:spore coat polysaccharide biosynthesis protein SpsF